MVSQVEPVTSLVPDLLARKDSAVDELVNRSLRRLIVAAMRYGAALREDAEEIALDAIYNTLRNLSNLSFKGVGGKDPLFNYMVKSARHAAIDLHRSKVKEQDALAELGATLAAARVPTVARFQSRDPEDDNDTTETGELRALSQGGSDEVMSGEVSQMSDFLSALTEGDRLLVQLHAEGVMTSGEIGREVGLSDAAVRQRVKRLRDRFRKERQDV